MKALTTGIVPSAQLVVIYGVEGVGKSTLANSQPNTLFLDIERGTLNLPIAARISIDDIDEVHETLNELATTKHPYQNVVLDSLDALYSMATSKILIKHKLKSIEDMGYAKAYTHVREEMESVCDDIQRVLDAGINVILVAHAEAQTMSLKGQEPFQQWSLKVGGNNNQSKLISAMFREKADAILFCYWNISHEKSGIVKGGNIRWVVTNHTSFCLAKNRHNLPIDGEISPAILEAIFSNNPSEDLDQAMQELDQTQLIAYLASINFIPEGGTLSDLSQKRIKQLNSNTQRVIDAFNKYTETQAQ